MAKIISPDELEIKIANKDKIMSKNNKIEDIVDMVFRKPPSIDRIIGKLLQNAYFAGRDRDVGSLIEMLPYHERKVLEKATYKDFYHRVDNLLVEKGNRWYLINQTAKYAKRISNIK